jgi:hypothetical protein
VYVLTTSAGGILGQCVALVSLSVIASASTFTFLLQNYMYPNLNQIYNILYLEHAIDGLYVCNYVFLLRQESFDMIWITTRHFMIGMLLISSQAWPPTGRLHVYLEMKPKVLQHNG